MTLNTRILLVKKLTFFKILHKITFGLAKTPLPYFTFQFSPYFYSNFFLSILKKNSYHHDLKTNILAKKNHILFFVSESFNWTNEMTRILQNRENFRSFLLKKLKTFLKISQFFKFWNHFW